MLEAAIRCVLTNWAWWHIAMQCSTADIDSWWEWTGSLTLELLYMAWWVAVLIQNCKNSGGLSGPNLSMHCVRMFFFLHVQDSTRWTNGLIRVHFPFVACWHRWNGILKSMTRMNAIQFICHSNQDKSMWQTTLKVCKRSHRVNYIRFAEPLTWLRGNVIFKEGSVTGNRMTKERHTIISIFLVTSTMAGRKDDSEFQHSPHILHQSSVK